LDGENGGRVTAPVLPAIILTVFSDFCRVSGVLEVLIKYRIAGKNKRRLRSTVCRD
jgi:hypothetical protein